MEKLQSHRMTNGLLMGKYLRIFSYIRKPFLMTLQQLHSEFPYITYMRTIFFFVSVLHLGVCAQQGLSSVGSGVASNGNQNFA
jgi:hypothetical protein